ncbi:hypothetical protein FALBO_13158 [Fusarium albosuccineum]|uniref:Uncharacterized protein n=1 Tax=Fusarium albosuccineum TaxID=1237068 RepID=A0A8H4L0I3_9HYPO|nr:hypothetical protein FALBO_13158 [Fusarium albosuccineum]
MSSSTVSTGQGAGAAKYALSEGCFYHHRDAPYRFQDQLHQLQTTRLPVETDGLVHQPGLVDTPLSHPRIQLDSPPADHYEDSLLIDDIVPRPTVSSSERNIRQLRFPRETLDLGHNLDQDFRKYMNDVHEKRSCNIFGEWLPLSPVNNNRDEGIEFPYTTSRWQLLALRELERESISISEKALPDLLGEDSTKQMNDPTWRRELFQWHKQPRAYPEPISLPLSPASEPADPFVPNSDAMVIDLTSEPDSPMNPAVEKLQQGLQDGRLDSEPAAPSTLSSSPPITSAAMLGATANKTSNLKLDVPLMTSSPQSFSKQNLHGEAFELEEMETEGSFQYRAGSSRGSPGFFDDAMLAILDGYHEQAEQMLANERPNPANSLLRMQVPAVDFRISDPDWLQHLSSSQDQFNWLKENLSSAFQLPTPCHLTGLGASLKWTPVPQGIGRVPVNEGIEQLGQAARDLLSLGVSQLHSQDYVVKSSGLKVFQLLDDEQIEDADTTRTLSPVLAPHGTPLEAQPSTKPTAANNNLTLDALLKSRQQSLRRNTMDDAPHLPLDSTNSNTTGRLLSSFLELRCSKKRKTTDTTSTQPPVHVNSPSQPSLIGPAMHHRLQEANHNGIHEASAPDFRIPMERCQYIVSTNLNQSVISQLEKSWPQVELVDRDFSQYNSVVWSQALDQPTKVASSVVFEADISLCPSAGIIVTTMLKVRQRPLPGSHGLTPLRERVYHSSSKYESLFILVSESNPTGEYASSQNASDIAAYADFLRFTASLRAGIITYLVSGAERTLSKWILALMCRFATQTCHFGQSLDYRDTTWELFLCRAGLNISAAKVISRALFSEYDNFGLAIFLAMTAEERVSKYGQIMGGERVLRNVSSVLQQDWAST